MTEEAWQGKNRPSKINVPLILPGRGIERGRAGNGRVPLMINEGSKMKNTTERPRRVFRLQRRIPYMGTKPGPAREIFSLSVPRDVVKAMGLAKGDRFRFRRGRGGRLEYEAIGDACPRCGREPARAD